MPSEPSNPGRADDAPTDLDPAAPPQLVEEPPPILGTWRKAYTVVIVTQVVLLALFYLVTVTFR